MDNGNEMVYPQSYIGADAPHEGIGGGLTKREHFAAMAMQGMAADNNVTVAAVAAWSVQYADALLAELAKEQAKDVLEALRPEIEDAGTCAWYDDGGDMWVSACGVAYTFNDGGPVENEHDYCIKCGKKVLVLEDDAARQEGK